MGWFRSSRSPRGDERAPSFEERLAAIEPGVPGHCPSCDGLGYIDELDIGRRYQIQHCKSCGHRWEYLFDADARVVGVTELDDQGRPVARMRVRNHVLLADVAADRPAAPALVPLEAAPEQAAPEQDGVIDLRDSPDPTVIDVRETAGEEPETGTGHMSPAEWLRHSLGR